MSLLKRIAGGILARWWDVGRFPSIEILDVTGDGMRVRLHPPSPGHRLASLAGDADALRRVGVRAPDGWRVEGSRAGDVAQLAFRPEAPLTVPPEGLELRIPFEDPAAPPARLAVHMEARRVVGGGGASIGFPVGGLHPVEVEAYNRRSSLTRKAQALGVPWGSLPAADEVRELERRAGALRGVR